MEGVPAIPQNPTVILENPPEVPDFRVYEPFPELAWDMVDNIIAIEGAGKTVKPVAKVMGSGKHGVKWKEGASRAKDTGKPKVNGQRKI